MIKKLENEYAKMSLKKSERLKTTAAAFGKGEDLEEFRMTHIHKRKQLELMPVPR